jgi:hypothetical protein
MPALEDRLTQQSEENCVSWNLEKAEKNLNRNLRQRGSRDKARENKKLLQYSDLKYNNRI